MLALLRRHVGKLPDRRIELYEQYIRTLIDNWHTVRSPGARQQAPERFDPHTAIAYLIELAFWLQQHKPSGTARRQELEQVLETICLRFEGHDLATVSPKALVQAQQTAARFLQDMRHFAGLLAERGRDAFGFLHLTFQEYFCGRALARMEPDERWTAIQPNLHRPRWREPILLCAGQLGVVEQRRARVSDLALRVLNAGSAYEPILHRDLFLTAALAADNVGLFPTPLDTIAAQLASLQTNPIPTVRNTTFAGLAQLARLGHAPALASLEKALRDPVLQRHVIGAVRVVLGSEQCIALRQEILTKLEDRGESVRQAAVEALTGMVASDERVRQAILTTLEDPDWSVRQAAVRALTGMVASDERVRRAILTKLEDRRESLRHVAVRTLMPLVASDNGIKQRLLSWLGVIVEEPIRLDIRETGQETQRLLADIYAPLLATDPKLLDQVTTMLTSPAWPVRQGAARTLIAMPGGPPPHVLPTLRGLLDDVRGEESWPQRLKVAELLINDRDQTLSRRAIAVALEELDYTISTWNRMSRLGPQVRGQAVRILGQLEPSYRDEAIFDRLTRIITEDASEEVRDAAYGVLLRLAAAPEAVPEGEPH
jgi:HEAT repeat protein